MIYHKLSQGAAFFTLNGKMLILCQDNSFSLFQFDEIDLKYTFN